MLSFSVILKISVKQVIKSITERCETTTAFGVPVEPDVKFAYTGSVSIMFFQRISEYFSV